MNEIRIAILCGGPFAFPALQKLAFEKYLCGVAIGGSDFRVTANIEEECKKNNFAFLEINSGRNISQLEDWLIELKPDAVFSICFPYKLSNELIQKFEGQIYNFHPGPLPEFRGPAPIFEVLKKGRRETALTVHRMDAEYDSGNIIFSERIKIEELFSYAALAEKLSRITGMAVVNLAEMLKFSRSKIAGTVQDECTATFYPFPKDSDFEIDWEKMNSDEVLNLIRACSDWTRGAITWLGEEKLRIPEAAIDSSLKYPHGRPGIIVDLLDEQKWVVRSVDQKYIVIPQISSDFGVLGLDYLRELGLDINSEFSKNNQILNHN